jgi:MFS family permease
MSAGRKPWGRGTLALLRPGPFRRYIVGTSISDTGTWMQIMAQGWVMSTLTDKAIMLGMVNFAAGLPMIFLTMFGGSMADRFDKRRILVWTQVVQIALAVLVGILIFSGRIQIWHIIAVAGLVGIAFAFEHPALSALVPELVTHEGNRRRSRLGSGGLSLCTTGRSIGRGTDRRSLGRRDRIFHQRVSFFAFIIALVSLPPRPIGSQEEEQQRASGIKDGFRYVRADKPSLAMVGMIASMTIFVFPTVSVMMPLYVRDVLHFGPDRLGYLMAASGIGSVFGAITLVSIARSRRLGWMMASAVAVMFAVLALSRVTTFGFAAASLVVHLVWLIPYLWPFEHNRAGAGAVTSPRPRLGRHGLSFFGLMPIAGLGVTSLADSIGMRTALAISAVGYGATALFILAG